MPYTTTAPQKYLVQGAFGLNFLKRNLKFAHLKEYLFSELICLLASDELFEITVFGYITNMRREDFSISSLSFVFWKQCLLVFMLGVRTCQTLVLVSFAALRHRLCPSKGWCFLLLRWAWGDVRRKVCGECGPREHGLAGWALVPLWSRW